MPRRELTDLLDEVPGDEEREFPHLPPEPDETTRVPVRRAITKQTFRPSDWRTVRRSNPVGLTTPETEVKRFVPAPDQNSGPSSGSADVEEIGTEPVNTYDGPEPKKARNAYDLKWVEQLSDSSQDLDDLQAFVCSMAPEEDVICIAFDVMPESHTKKKALMRSPITYIW